MKFLFFVFLLASILAVSVVNVDGCSAANSGPAVPCTFGGYVSVPLYPDDPVNPFGFYQLSCSKNNVICSNVNVLGTCQTFSYSSACVPTEWSTRPYTAAEVAAYSARCTASTFTPQACIDNSVTGGSSPTGITDPVSTSVTVADSTNDQTIDAGDNNISSPPTTQIDIDLVKEIVALAIENDRTIRGQTSMATASYPSMIVMMIMSMAIAAIMNINRF